MTRTTGSLNKRPSNHPEILDLSTEERLEFVINLIVDQILEAQRTDFQLIKELGLESHVERITS